MVNTLAYHGKLFFSNSTFSNIKLQFHNLRFAGLHGDQIFLLRCRVKAHTYLVMPLVIVVRRCWQLWPHSIICTISLALIVNRPFIIVESLFKTFRDGILASIKFRSDPENFLNTSPYFKAFVNRSHYLPYNSCKQRLKVENNL